MMTKHRSSMSHPFFYADKLESVGSLSLDEETSRHVVQVLRMKEGEQIRLTNGRGLSCDCEIMDAHKKHCSVNILSSSYTEQQQPQLTIAISLVKNSSRFEWFLEKATELGTASIIPLICERTEKQHFRLDRFQSICRSAMLQSMQVWLPRLTEPQRFPGVIDTAAQAQKFIAHCMDSERRELYAAFDRSLSSQIILIGPEGDFTATEITHALAAGFTAVSLGSTRLRTETAGIYAAAVCRK